MTKISRDKLKAESFDANGVALNYPVALEDLEFEFKTSQVCELWKEIRTILRAMHNLEESLESFIELEKKYKNVQRQVIFNIENHALFSRAIVLYGACFVKGEKRERPLEKFIPKFKSQNTHYQIMTYRDKLLGHIDENHNVRTDVLRWSLIANGEHLTPSLPLLGGHKTVLEAGDSKWIDHVKDVLSIVKQEEISLTASMNSIIGRVSIY